MVYLKKLIRFYQRVSPFIKKPCCRFYPCCSEYALQALNNYPGFIAVYLILNRMIRCQPFCQAGINFIPTTVKFGSFVWHAKQKDNTAVSP